MKKDIHIIFPPCQTYGKMKKRAMHILKGLSEREGITVHFVNSNKEKFGSIHRDSKDNDLKNKTIAKIGERFIIYPDNETCSEHVNAISGADSVKIFKIRAPMFYSHARFYGGINYIWYDIADIFECFKISMSKYLNSSSLITTSSKGVHDFYLSPIKGLKKGNQIVIHIGNGCDVNHFDYKKNFDRPADLPEGKKIVGYSGVIAEWFDMNNYMKLVKEMPDVNFVIIGSVLKHQYSFNIESGWNIPENLFFLGLKSYEELPQYIANFDVCLIPFVSESELIEVTDPLKFYEYAAMGKPIVSAELPEIRHYGIADIYKNFDDLKHFVSCRIKVGSSIEERENRRCVAESSDWSNKIDQLEEAIREMVGDL